MMKMGATQAAWLPFLGLRSLAQGAVAQTSSTPVPEDNTMQLTRHHVLAALAVMSTAAASTALGQSAPASTAPPAMSLVRPIATPGPVASPRPKLPKLMQVVEGSCATPVYPEQSLRDEQTGTVDMAFLVDKSGKVLDSKIVRSSGFDLLNDAALSALRQCKFARIDHAPITKATWTSWTYVWSLE